MGIISYIKVGAIAAVIIVAGYFIYNYQHRGRVIEAQKIVIEQHEAAEKFYKNQPKVDEQTQEIKNEIKKAVDTGDPDKLQSLYKQLREHQRTLKGKTPR